MAPPQYSFLRVYLAVLAAWAACGVAGTMIALTLLTTSPAGISVQTASLGAIFGMILGLLHVVAGTALFSLFIFRWRARWWNLALGGGLVGAVPMPLLFGSSALASGVTDWLPFLAAAGVLGLAGVMAGLAFRLMLGPDRRAAD